MSKPADAHTSTIILSAGPLNVMNLPLGTNVSNAMVPVNGKPVIGWILDDLLTKGIRRATIVLRQDNDRLALFLGRAYAARMDLTLATVSGEGSILDSLTAGLAAAGGDGPVRVLLGDTLVLDGFECETDTVFAADVEDSSRWCVVATSPGGIVSAFHDKQALEGTRHSALVGYYHLMDSAHLRSAVASARASGERELSAALSRYGERHPIAARAVAEWLDFGHVDNFVQAKHRLLQSRFFNSLKVDPVLNTITKVSTDDAKLQDELAWYQALPDELKVLTPRIVNHQRANGGLEVVQEYYGYPTLAELYVFGDLPADAWRSTLHRVMAIHQHLRRYEGPVPPGDIVEMYSSKTIERLRVLAAGSAEWAAQLERTDVSLNGRPLRNLPALRSAIDRKAHELSESTSGSIIHGDFCFSNILFDFPNQIIRLIDPRGSFGAKGIYGDPRYDMAKLRHSVCGRYDFIVADMFTIQVDDGSARAEICGDATAVAVAEMFDDMLTAAGYDLDAIRFIEGLLFLSMLPLHQGKPLRQQMMYFTGLNLLNGAL